MELEHRSTPIFKIVIWMTEREGGRKGEARGGNNKEGIGNIDSSS